MFILQMQETYVNVQKHKEAFCCAAGMRSHASLWEDIGKRKLQLESVRQYEKSGLFSPGPHLCPLALGNELHLGNINCNDNDRQFIRLSTSILILV